MIYPAIILRTPAIVPTVIPPRILSDTVLENPPDISGFLQEFRLRFFQKFVQGFIQEFF